MAVKKRVPPNGGYGWIIVISSAGNFFLTFPLLQTFGLIFVDEFKIMGLSATQSSLIININCAFGMMTGPFNGILLKYYGYRKIAYLGACCLTFGIIFTSMVQTFTGFILFYGVITCFALCVNSHNFAVNTYFTEKKSKAISIMMTLTAFGPIIMPILINFLISLYDTAGVILILGGICAHSFVSASLLQPVKRHYKIVYENEEPFKKDVFLINDEIDSMNDIDKNEDDGPIENLLKGGMLYNENEKNIESNYEQSLDIVVNVPATLHGSYLSLADLNLSCSNLSQTKTQWWKSKSTVNLESSVNIFNDKPPVIDGDTGEDHISIEENEKRYTTSCLEEIIHKVTNIFDLDLLRDGTFCNILFGMSLAVFAEINFSVLTAFILNDLSLTTSKIAQFMSLMGFADLLFRFFAPYIADYVKKPPRIMYMYTLCALIITRTGLIIFNNFYALLVVATFLGFAKGVRTVYMSLVIPTYVPLEKLPSASGLQMMINGIFILIGGPLLGLLRDITGSYYICIIIMNLVTFFTIMLWTSEMLYKKYQTRREMS